MPNIEEKNPGDHLLPCLVLHATCISYFAVLDVVLHMHAACRGRSRCSVGEPRHIAQTPCIDTGPVGRVVPVAMAWIWHILRNYWNMPTWGACSTLTSRRSGAKLMRFQMYAMYGLSFVNHCQSISLLKWSSMYKNDIIKVDKIAFKMHIFTIIC